MFLTINTNDVFLGDVKLSLSFTSDLVLVDLLSGIDPSLTERRNFDNSMDDFPFLSLNWLDKSLGMGSPSDSWCYSYLQHYDVSHWTENIKRKDFNNHDFVLSHTCPCGTWNRTGLISRIFSYSNVNLVNWKESVWKVRRRSITWRILRTSSSFVFFFFPFFRFRETLFCEVVSFSRQTRVWRDSLNTVLSNTRISVSHLKKWRFTFPDRLRLFSKFCLE